MSKGEEYVQLLMHERVNELSARVAELEALQLQRTDQRMQVALNGLMQAQKRMAAKMAIWNAVSA